MPTQTTDARVTPPPIASLLLHLPMFRRAAATPETPIQLRDGTVTRADRHGSHGRLAETFVAIPAELGGLRAVMRSWLAFQRVTEWDANDILLAVGEAASNAIEHAFRSGKPGRIEIDAVRNGGFIVIRIRDNGRWRAEPAPGDRGRGLPLMRRVSRVDLRTSPSGTTVTLRRRLEGE